MTLGAYRRALDVVSLGFFSAVRPVVNGYLAGPQGNRERSALIDSLFDTTGVYRRRAYTVATTQLIEQAKTQSGIAPADMFVPNLRNYDRRATESVVNTVLQRGDSEQTNASHNPTLDIAKGLQAHVEGAARSVATDAAEATLNADQRDLKQPVAWARTLSGAENCAFCVVMASRGAVYKTKESAGGTEESLFHPNCDCIAIPVYNRSDWPGMDTAAELYKVYAKARRTHKDTNPINAVRRELTKTPDLLSDSVPDLRAAA